jgi:hypothetical protein
MGKRIEIIFRYKNYGIGKYGKYNVLIQTEYDELKYYWISEKQKNKLDILFGWFERSTPDYIIYGAFEDNRFIWAGESATDLCKYFNIPLSTIPDITRIIWPGQIPDLPIPKDVEIADELKDNLT